MVRVMVARDVRHAHRLDSSGISPLTAAITLQVIGIFPRRENGGVVLGAIPEHEDRGDAFDRAQHGPIRLARSRKFTLDDVICLLRIRRRKSLLWDHSLPALKLLQQIGRKLRGMRLVAAAQCIFPGMSPVIGMSLAIGRRRSPRRRAPMP